MTWSINAAGDRDAVIRQLKVQNPSSQYDPTGLGTTLASLIAAEMAKLTVDYPHADVVYVVTGGGHADNQTMSFTLSVQPTYVPKGTLHDHNVDPSLGDDLMENQATEPSGALEN